jgi:dihydroorotase
MREQLTRRSFLTAAGAAAAFGQDGRPYDILIRNGEVRDPARRFSARADVGILDGRIAAIEPSIPAERGRDIIEAQGLYVTPGLIDLHTHCYLGGSGNSIEADPLAARSGVTTWVDAGSFPYDTFAGFQRYIVERSQVRVFAYVYLYPSLRNPDINPVEYVRSMMRRTADVVIRNREILLGVKIQMGSTVSGRYSLDFLKIARELGDAYNIPLMVHLGQAPPETSEVMPLLRRGDVVTHAYNGRSLGLLDPLGLPRPGVLEARRRGVWFDLGHGQTSFSFDAAHRCLEAGLVVDTISSDVHELVLNGPVYDLPTTMSKLMHLGMSFEDVLLRVTANPARIIGRVQGLGTLQVGSPADVALLALEEGKFELEDSQRRIEIAKQRITSRLTICRGRRVVAPV